LSAGVSVALGVSVGVSVAFGFSVSVLVAFGVLAGVADRSSAAFLVAAGVEIWTAVAGSPRERPTSANVPSESATASAAPPNPRATTVRMRLMMQAYASEC